MNEPETIAAAIPSPLTFHVETLAERRALLGKDQRGSQIAIAWCWRNAVGGYFHPVAQMWVTYSGPGFSLSDFLNYLAANGFQLPSRSVVDAWCLAVREPVGNRRH